MPAGPSRPRKVVIHSEVGDLIRYVDDPAETWGRLCQRIVETDLLPRLLSPLARLAPAWRLHAYRLRYGEGRCTIVRPVWRPAGCTSKDAYLDANVTLRMSEGRDGAGPVFSPHETVLASCTASGGVHVDVRWERVGAHAGRFSDWGGPFSPIADRTRVLFCEEHATFPGFIDSYRFEDAAGAGESHVLPSRCINMSWDDSAPTVGETDSLSVNADDDACGVEQFYRRRDGAQHDHDKGEHNDFVRVNKRRKRERQGEGRQGDGGATDGGDRTAKAANCVDIDKSRGTVPAGASDSVGAADGDSVVSVRVSADGIFSSTSREDGGAAIQRLDDNFHDEAAAAAHDASRGQDLMLGRAADEKNCGAEMRGRDQKRAPRVTRSPVAKREKTNVPVSGEYRVVCAARPKPTSKSPLFMASRASIFAAACKFPSLLSALQGSNNNYRYQEQDWNASICTTYAEIDGCCLAMEHSLAVIYLHFRGCPTFDQQFNQFVQNAEFLSLRTVERALHRSVRHLCDAGCFQRAYGAIREFAYFWRGVTIEGPNCANGSPGRRGWRPTKEELFSGWGCKLLSPMDSGATSGITRKKKVQCRAPSSAIAFVSPDGNELATKTQATKYMNKSLSSLARTCTSSQQEPIPAPTTLLIDAVTNIDPLCSPFGLLEEIFLRDPWKLLVSTIFLNVTTRVQVDQTLYHFLQGWPDAKATARANWEEIAALVSPLGLGTKRAQALVRFSREYLALTEDVDSFALTEKQVRGLYNIGLYGWTAYKVFILKRLPSGSVKVCDHALQLYVEYQLGRQAAEARERLRFGKHLRT